MNIWRQSPWWPAGRLAHAGGGGRGLLKRLPWLACLTGTAAVLCALALAGASEEPAGDGDAAQVAAVAFDHRSEVVLLHPEEGRWLRTLAMSGASSDLAFSGAARLVVAQEDGIESTNLAEPGDTWWLGISEAEHLVADAWSGRIYVSHNGPRAVSAVTMGSRGKIDWTTRVEGELSALALAPNGDALYAGFGREPGRVAVIDTVTGRVGRMVTVGSEPSALALSADGQTLYVLERSGGVLTAIAIADDRDRITVRVGGNARALVLSPDGTAIYVSDTAHKALLVLDSARLTLRQTVSLPGQPDDLAITPDGRRLLVASPQTFSVFAVETATLRVVRTQRFFWRPRRVVCAAGPLTPGITPTPVRTCTGTATGAPTATPSARCTRTAIRGPTRTLTATPAWTPTATPTVFPSDTPTGTPPHTPTITFTATPSATATNVPAATSTEMPTARPTETATATPPPSPSLTRTHTPTNTPVPPGIMVGEVYDDGSAQALAGVAVESRAVGDGSPATVASVSTDRAGRYALSAPAGEQLITLAKDGYTRAVRRLTVLPAGATQPLDARLTTLNAAVTIGSAGGTVLAPFNPPATGTPANRLTGAPIQLLVAANVLPDGTGLQLTPLSPQGLIAPVPLGWSVLMGVDLRIDVTGVTNATTGEPWAHLRVPAAPLARGASVPVVSAVWEDSARQWVGGPSATLDGDAIDIPLSLPLAPNVQIALLVADTIPAAPPVTTPGAPLDGVLAAPAQANSGSVVAQPPSIVTGSEAGADVLLAVTSLTQPLSSGTVLNAALREIYNLRDGREIAGTIAIEDIIGYQFAPTLAPSNATTLGAYLALIPSRNFGLGDLVDGRVTIDLDLALTGVAVHLIGPDGADLNGPNGMRLLVPPNAASAGTVLNLAPGAAASLPAGAVDRPDFAGSFTLQVASGGLDPITAYGIDLGVPATDGGWFVIGKVPTGDTSGGLVISALGYGTSGRVVLDACPAAFGGCLDGLSNGTYAIFTLSSDAVLVTGTVRDSSGGRVGIVVTSNQLPVVGVTALDGRYMLPAPVGRTSTLTANDPINDLSGFVAILPPPDSRLFSLPLTADIELRATPPQVTQINPPNHGGNVAPDTTIMITFSKPIAPATITDASVWLGRVDSQQSIVDSRKSLNADGTQLLLTPAAPLAPNTVYQLAITSDITDRHGNRLTVFTSDFTTATIFKAAALPPNTLRVSLPDEQGRVFVCGGAQLAAPGTEVIVTDDTSGLTRSVTATGGDGVSGSEECDWLPDFQGRCNTDLPGSFCLVIDAAIGDTVVVQVKDALDNTITVDAGNMRDERTGATAVGPEGGVVTAADDERYHLSVPEGVFGEVTLITVTPTSAQDLPKTADAFIEMVAGARLDFGGRVPVKQVDLSVPAPDDASADDQYLATRVINFRGADELTAVDTAFFDAARHLVTTDPSTFGGILFQGLFGLARTRGCTAFVTGFAVMSEPFSQTFVDGSMYLPFPNLSTEPLRYTVPVPCNGDARVSLRSAGDDEIDFLSLSTAPQRGEFVFTETILSDDRTPPRVIGSQTSIPDQAGNVGHDSEISIPFTEALLSKNLAGFDQIDPRAKLYCVMAGRKTEMRGTWSQSADGKRIFFVARDGQPLHGLPLGTHCQVEIGDVRDRNGNAMIDPFVMAFDTFRPAVVERVPGVDAIAVDSIGWRRTKGTASTTTPLLKQFIAIAEGDAYRPDSQGGVLVQEVTDLPGLTATPATLPTAGVDYAVRFLPAEDLTDAAGQTFAGPYLMTVDGAGGIQSRERFGVWRLYDLSGFGNGDIRQVAARDVNLSSDALDLLNSVDGNQSPETLRFLRQIPNDLGLPVDVAALGVGAAYVANPPTIGLELISVQGMNRDPSVQGVNNTLPGLFHAVATLGPWVIGARPDGLVVTDAALQRRPGVAPWAPADYPLPGASNLLTLSQWPVDINRNGKIDANERFDLVVANCMATTNLRIGPALCVIAFDLGSGEFRPQRLAGELRLPADASPRRMFADPERRLLYLANGTAGLTVVDFQDPSGSLDDSPPDWVDDRVLANIPLESSGAGVATAHDVAMDINVMDPALSGNVIAYVAAREDGWFLVDLGPARMTTVLLGYGRNAPYADQIVEVDEVRYFNEKAHSLYQPEIQLPGHLADLYPEQVTVTVEVIDRTGRQIETPGPEYAPASRDLTLQRVPRTNRYTLPRGPDGKFSEAIVVSNLPLDDGRGGGLHPLEANCHDTCGAVASFIEIYGGLGARLRLRADVAGTRLQGKERVLPVEKVQVIVLGIDGLRQDVLYPPSENAVREPGVDYHVDPTTLLGIGQVLGGRLNVVNYDPIGVPRIDGLLGDLERYHLRLPAVSAIFPSITLASWASIFTGAPPNQTGILGNEFFVRTDNNGPVGGLAAQSNDPMITLSEGAFPRGPLETRNLTPSGGWFNYEQPELWKADQNRSTDGGEHGGLLRGRVQTLFEQLATSNEEVFTTLRADYPPNSEMCGGQSGDGLAITTFNHYARGASCWLTMSDSEAADLSLGGSAALDRIPSNNAQDYLRDHLGAGGFPLQRNSQPFPAFFGLYLAGLDHEAHGTQDTGGHGLNEQTYKHHIASALDPAVARFVDTLRQLDEFYNKIFLITADHGHSRISDDPTETYPCQLALNPFETNWLKAMGDPELRAQETDGNNNLHIWELAKIIAAGNLLQSQPVFKPRLLVPSRMGGTSAAQADLGRGSLIETDTDRATLVAALNGDMAQLYLRPEGGEWTQHPSEKELGMVAEVLRLFLMNGQHIESSGARSFRNASHPALVSNAYQTLRTSLADLSRLIQGPSGAGPSPAVDLILVRPNGGDYVVYNGLQLSTDPGGVIIESLPLSEVLSSSYYVDAVNRVAEMNDPKRSGDIVLVMRTRTEDSPAQRFTAGVACRGWHGGLNRGDSYVPLILSYPGGNNALLDQIAQNACSSEANCNRNTALPELVKQVYREEHLQ